LIEVQNLTKSYGSHEAVRGLAFRVPAGQICGFLGPNGAGKSTTLRMLTGFLAPTTGTIRIGGIDALAEPIEARRHIGYMPEACPLYPEMRVSEYLKYRAELKGVPGRQIKGRVDAALSQASVADVGHRIIGQLSKGYRQRVGLADALVADPPLLILDEPTAGLDPNQIRQVRELIKELSKNKTVLLSTHILPEVEAICDRVLIITKGKLVSEGDPKGLRSELASKVIIALEGRGTVSAFRGCLEAIDGCRVVMVREKGGGSRRDSARGSQGLVVAQVESEDQDAAERIFEAVAKAGLVLRALNREEASLEDVFTNLTTAEPKSGADAEDEDEDQDEDDEEDAGDEDADDEDADDEDADDEDADDEDAGDAGDGDADDGDAGDDDADDEEEDR
jgi:ABC-2 type transport system ATP-binding protein